MPIMSEDTARVVYPIFRHGLRLKERLRHGERPDLDTVQNELRNLFAAGPTKGMDDPFLGFLYPLACWLDDIFILDPESPWRQEWKDKTFEGALFQSRDRASLFWEQCRMAEMRADTNALAVFYLCVMLGFRGQLRDDPNGLREWRDRIEPVLGGVQAEEWPDRPPELPVKPPDVDALTALQRLRVVYGIWAGLVGLAILVTAYVLVPK
jgi:type VI secretion system protein ImpK